MYNVVSQFSENFKDQLVSVRLGRHTLPLIERIVYFTASIQKVIFSNLSFIDTHSNNSQPDQDCTTNPFLIKILKFQKTNFACNFR